MAALAAWFLQFTLMCWTAKSVLVSGEAVILQLPDQPCHRITPRTTGTAWHPGSRSAARVAWTHGFGLGFGVLLTRLLAGTFGGSLTLAVGVLVRLVFWTRLLAGTLGGSLMLAVGVLLRLALGVVAGLLLFVEALVGWLLPLLRLATMPIAMNAPTTMPTHFRNFFIVTLFPLCR